MGYGRPFSFGGGSFAHQLQHHHRRYPYPREALGYGYERFDVVLPESQRIKKPTPLHQLQAEALAQQEAAQQRASSGMWFCASVPLLLIDL